MANYYLMLFVGVILLVSCNNVEPVNKTPAVGTKSILGYSDSILTRSALPFLYLYDTLLADGFDYPVGNRDGKGSYTDMTTGVHYSGWRIAVETGVRYELGIHTGEDWNGVGGGDTDLGQAVYSIGKGIVLTAEDYLPPWGNVVVIEHRCYKNGNVDTVFSLYAHLDTIHVKAGDTIDKRALIGTIGNADGIFSAHLHFEIRKNTMRDLSVTYWPSSEGKNIEWVLDHYYKPSDFIEERRKIKNLTEYKQLLIAVKSRYEMFFIRNDTVSKKYEICLGMVEGHKEKHRDYKTPIGEYKVLNKSKGPFSGDYADFFGTGWVKLNYPNKYDAIRGFENGIITESQKNSIINAIENGNVPPQGTGLGGGIGIHGWAGEWYADGTQNLTFGCLCMHNDDMSEFVDLVNVGMIVIILP